MIFHRIKMILLGLVNLFNYDVAPIEEVKIVAYEVEYVYVEKYSEGEEFIIKEGKSGYSRLIDGVEVEFREPINQVLKVGTHSSFDYTGILTGYGPDCKGCSKQGYVACKTGDKKNWSLISDGIVYNDLDYGEVNIVASDTTLFPCGTIIEINNKKYEKLLAVVLDTGYTMRNAWRNNKIIHLDLAFETEKETNDVTDKNTSYHVKRWGW